jgi:hypothetical protein
MLLFEEPRLVRETEKKVVKMEDFCEREIVTKMHRALTEKRYIYKEQNSLQ